jgi:glycosyltransferase involved in cell wall biosynthesis
MMKPLVSVVMPVYNADKFVVEAIESILNQSYTYFELIIVNDASTDESAKKILQIDDRRIQILENERNSGIVFSRNRGLNVAKGKYIAIIDSDDIALPNRLERQVEYLESHPYCGICGSYYQIIDQNGSKKVSFKVPTTAKDNKTFLLFNVPFCQSTIMMPSKIAKSFQYRVGFDIIEDYEIANRIAREYDICNLPIYTTLYRSHGSNITIDKREQMRSVRKKLDAEVLNHLNISFSVNELELHSNFINGCYDFFKEESTMEALEIWLMRYYEFVKGIPDYNLVFLRKMIAVRWWNLCQQTNNWTYLWNTTLLSELSISYFVSNFKHLASKIFKQMDVI